MSSTETNYDRITVYVADRDDWHDFIRQLEIDFDEVKQAEKRELHDALLHVAQENVDDVIDRLGGDTRDAE